MVLNPTTTAPLAAAKSTSVSVISPATASKTLICTSFWGNCFREPKEVEESLGVAQVRAVFTVGRGAVAGCYVQSGKVVRNRFIRVLRNGEALYEGNLDSLRRVKDDVKEVNAGYECGIGIAKFNDWQEGDIIEAYEMVFKRRTLSQ